VDVLDEHERDQLAPSAARPTRGATQHTLARLVLARSWVRPRSSTGRAAAAARHTANRSSGFSLSHAGELVEVAVRPDGPGAGRPQLRDVADLDALAGHVHSPAERSRPCPDPAGFFRTWTRKEALVKATGDGLSAPMTAITLAPDRPAVEEWTGPGAPSGPMWLHDLTPAPDHPAAVAGPGDRAPEIVEADGNAVLLA
jgi:4'-phosphopantetheinyl transferase